MGGLTLLFVGSVLFVNGLAVLGKVEPKAAAPINFFVGLTLVLTTGWSIWDVRDLAVDKNLDVVIGATGFLLFAFTYLYVGLRNYTDSEWHGVGWYCAWAAIVAVFLAVTNYTRLDDPKFGMLYVLWAILFFCFFIVLALDLDRFAWATGWVTVIEAFITTTIPGGLLLVGAWDDMPNWVATAAGLGTIVVFALLMLRRPMPDPPADDRGAVPPSAEAVGRAG